MRPQQPLIATRRLWSLWDMLDKYGHSCACVMRSTMQTESALADIIRDRPDATLKGTLFFGEPAPEANEPSFFLPLQLGVIKKDAVELGLQPTLHRLETMETTLKLNTPVSEVLQEFREIRRQFEYDLRSKLFLAVSAEDMAYWDQKALFGDDVNFQFEGAAEDIECAGNCLALGQGTACVLHLMRAMEVAMRRLGDRLSVTLRPSITWGGILNEIDPKIAALPNKTEAEHRKKHQWSEARALLWHVKEAWRDDSMHGKRTYTQQQARDVLNAVRAFMQHLATL